MIYIRSDLELINNYMKHKYKNWYDTIIKNAQNRVTEDYTEQHHIVPRSLGGSDDPTNLVALTAREHFICHVLLTKFTTGQDRNKMLHAVIIMKGKNKEQPRYFNSRLYEAVRQDYANKRSIEQQGENNSYYGKKHSAKTRAKMSASKRKLFESGWVNPHIGMKRSEETRKNISLSKKGKPSTKKGIPQGALTDAQKQKHKEAIQGKCFWWTDGVNNLRAAECPSGYKKGRTMSPLHYSKFTKKISDS